MATPYFDQDQEFWRQRARELPGAQGWAARFGPNVATGLGQELASKEGFLVTPQPVAPMPLRNDAAAKAQERKATSRQRQRRGRASTILTPFNVEDGLLGG